MSSLNVNKTNPHQAFPYPPPPSSTTPKARPKLPLLPKPQDTPSNTSLLKPTPPPPLPATSKAKAQAKTLQSRPAAPSTSPPRAPSVILVTAPPKPLNINNDVLDSFDPIKNFDEVKTILGDSYPLRVAFQLKDLFDSIKEIQSKPTLSNADQQSIFNLLDSAQTLINISPANRVFLTEDEANSLFKSLHSFLKENKEEHINVELARSIMYLADYYIITRNKNQGFIKSLLNKSEVKETFKLCKSQINQNIREFEQNIVNKHQNKHNYYKSLLDEFKSIAYYLDQQTPYLDKKSKWLKTLPLDLWKRNNSWANINLKENNIFLEEFEEHVNECSQLNWYEAVMAWRFLITGIVAYNDSPTLSPTNVTLARNSYLEALLKSIRLHIDSETTVPVYRLAFWAADRLLILYGCTTDPDIKSFVKNKLENYAKTYTNMQPFVTAMSTLLPRDGYFD